MLQDNNPGRGTQRKGNGRVQTRESGIGNEEPTNHLPTRGKKGSLARIYAVLENFRLEQNLRKPDLVLASLRQFELLTQKKTSALANSGVKGNGNTEALKNARKLKKNLLPWGCQNCQSRCKTEPKTDCIYSRFFGDSTEEQKQPALL